MWSSGANTIKFSTAGADVGTISSAGAWTFPTNTTHLFGNTTTIENCQVQIKAEVTKNAYLSFFSGTSQSYIGVGPAGVLVTDSTAGDLQIANSNAAKGISFGVGSGAALCGRLSNTGVWTLGPASSTATNLAVNGAMSTTHAVFGGSSYTASVYHEFKGADGFIARGDNAVNYDFNVTNIRSTSIGTSGARILLSANDGNKVAVWSSITGSNIRFGALTALDVDFVSGSSGTTKVGGFTSAGVWTLGGSATGASHIAQGYSPVGGNSSGNGSIQLGNGIAACGVIHFDTAGSTTLYIDSNYNSASTTTKFRMRIDGGSPITAGSYTGAGLWYNYSNTTTWNTTSDIRVKKNVREVGGALDKILALHPVHFEYIHRPDTTKTGFIAQEVEAVLPGHVVSTSCPDEIAAIKPELKDELIKGLDMDIMPYMVKAIQELSAKNDALEARLAALEV
jgi:hypothetical protein